MGCGCGGRGKAIRPPANFKVKPPCFPGEKGFVLLECVAERYGNRGRVSGCHYTLKQGQRIYADVRDLSGLDKRAFKKCESLSSESGAAGSTPTGRG